MKYEDITRRIISAAMKVHSALGNGFQEVYPVRYFKNSNKKRNPIII